jgi:hypothetical protein
MSPWLAARRQDEDRTGLATPLAQTYVRVMPNSWRDGFEYAYTRPDPEPDGPGLTWRETGANYWSGSSGSQPRGTVMLETSGLWVAYVRLDDPPGALTHHHRRPIRSAAQVTAPLYTWWSVGRVRLRIRLAAKRGRARRTPGIPSR